MRIHKGDKVLIISGKDKGKTGKVVKSLPACAGRPSLGKVVVEDVNVKKKHTRPKKEGQKGQIIQMAMPVDVSNVKLICGKCDKPTRVGYKFLENKRKVRICKKCGNEI